MHEHSSAWSASTCTLFAATCTNPPATKELWEVEPCFRVKVPGSMMDKSGAWPGRTPNRPSNPGTITSSTAWERTRLSGVTISNVSEANSCLLKFQVDRLGVHRFQFDFILVIHSRHRPRDPRHALEPKEVPVQLANL